jgi:hypothetical protein
VTQRALRESSHDSNEGDRENDALNRDLGKPRSNKAVFVVFLVS